MELSEKRRLFVEAYMGEAAGNATEAARLAGYSHPGSQGHRLLKNAEIIQAIEERSSSDPRVMTREELQRWWTSVVRGEELTDAEPKDRLKASELLAKAQAIFVKKVEHSGGVQVNTFAELAKAAQS